MATALILVTALVLVVSLTWVTFHAIADRPPVCTSAVYALDGTATVYDEHGAIVAVGATHDTVNVLFNR